MPRLSGPEGPGEPWKDGSSSRHLTEPRITQAKAVVSERGVRGR